jgi:hypothetical protein
VTSAEIYRALKAYRPAENTIVNLQGDSDFHHEGRLRVYAHPNIHRSTAKRCRLNPQLHTGLPLWDVP